MYVSFDLATPPWILRIYLKVTQFSRLVIPNVLIAHKNISENMCTLCGTKRILKLCDSFQILWFWLVLCDLGQVSRPPWAPACLPTKWREIEQTLGEGSGSGKRQSPGFTALLPTAGHSQSPARPLTPTSSDSGTACRMPGCRSANAWADLSGGLWTGSLGAITWDHLFQLWSCPPPFSFTLGLFSRIWEFLKLEGVGKGEAGRDVQGSWRQKG